MLCRKLVGSSSPSAKAASNELLRLALQLGLPPAQLLDALLAHDGGPAVYESLAATLHRWLLFNAADVMPAVLAAIAAPFAAGRELLPQGRHAPQVRYMESDCFYWFVNASFKHSQKHRLLVGTVCIGMLQSLFPFFLPFVQVAESLLLGTIESLRRARETSRFPDVHQGAFVAALLAGLPALRPLLRRDGGGTGNGRDLLLRLIGALLEVS